MQFQGSRWIGPTAGNPATEIPAAEHERRLPLADDGERIEQAVHIEGSHGRPMTSPNETCRERSAC